MKGRPRGNEAARFLSIGIGLALQLHAGRRLTYYAIAEEYSISKRTAIRWAVALERVLPLAKTTNGDGRTVFYIPRDMRKNFGRVA